MRTVITGEAVASCFGDAEQTFAALLAGETGVGRIRHLDAGRVNVDYAYQIDDAGVARPLTPSRWLADCVRTALAQAGVEPARERVYAVVGAGLRELRTVEITRDGDPPPTERLHFGPVLRAAMPSVRGVLTVSNACSAGGHALALAQDAIELDLADAVVVAATDTLTESMLAMIGRVVQQPTTMLRPFDADRTGVLLGEGAVALVVQPESAAATPLARLRATGLSCDAFHPTAPDPGGIARAMRDAHHRAGVRADRIDLLVGHGSGTGLNDPAEVAAIRETLGTGPLVTAFKGAVGHTSGGAALLGVAMAVRCLATGMIPPVVGLRRPLEQGAGVRFVIDRAVPARPRFAQVNAFGFGGVNSVTILERVAGARRRRPVPGTPARGGGPARRGPGTAIAITGWGVHVPGPAPTITIGGTALAGAQVPGLGGAVAAGQAGELLGRRGLLGLEPSTRLALCAVHAALGGAPRRPRAPAGPDPRTAVVVSSNLGNMATVVHTVDTVRTGSWRQVSPLDAPNASSNVIATTIAIWFQLGGPNLMICSGATSGLDAVAAGVSLLLADRADRVVVAGAEPDDDVAQYLHRARSCAAARRPLRAGAGCVVLETVDRAGATAPRLVLDPAPPGVAPQPPSGLVGLPEAWGDLYGAGGVVALAAAASLLAGGRVRGPCRVGCGDEADGWRFAGIAAAAEVGHAG